MFNVSVGGALRLFMLHNVLANIVVALMQIQKKKT